MMQAGRPLKSLLPPDMDISIDRDTVGEVYVGGLAVDSRTVRPGDVFFALPGAVVDGRDFIDAAIQRGAVAIIFETEGYSVGESAGESAEDASEQTLLIGVKGLRDWVGEMASLYYQEPSKKLNVIAVTGTNGKTSCTHYLGQMAQYLGVDSAVIGTLGAGRLSDLSVTFNTTPDAVSVQRSLSEFAEGRVQMVAVEASSHGLDQGRLKGTTVRTAVVTNITRDHLDYHGSMENYISAKRRLLSFPGLQRVVLNHDDANVISMAEQLPSFIESVSFSTQGNTAADWWASDIQPTERGVAFVVHYDGRQWSVEVPLFGLFNVGNVLAVLAALARDESALDTIVEGLSQLRPVSGRMQAFDMGSEVLAIVDYAHTPDALSQALSALRPHCRGQLTVVFGCGGERDQGKRALMGQVADKLADRIILTDDNPRSESPEAIIESIKEGIRNTEYAINHDRAQAVHQALLLAEPGDVVLVAGKGHERYQLYGDERQPYSDIDVVSRMREAQQVTV